jgi:hypothetical protein
MDTMSLEPLVLHVTVRMAGTRVEVHCLELDIVTGALTREEALNNIVDLVRVQFAVARERNNLDNLFFPAPPEYWRSLARARLVGSRLVDLHDDGDASDLPPIPAAATGLRLQEFAIDS